MGDHGDFAGKFQSTLPMKGATCLPVSQPWRLLVSIHAPNEGSDPHIKHDCFSCVDVSIHAPNEGSDC